MLNLFQCHRLRHLDEDVEEIEVVADFGHRHIHQLWSSLKMVLFGHLSIANLMRDSADDIIFRFQGPNQFSKGSNNVLT